MHCKDAILDTDQLALATAACAGYQSKVLDGQTTSRPASVNGSHWNA